MKILSLIIAIFSVCYAAASSAITPQVLTLDELINVKDLACAPADYSYQNNGRLILGNDQNPQPQLFLIKNISTQNIYVDFPEGHTGASAGIGRYIKAQQWTGYLYSVKNNLPRPAWTCNTTDTSCRNALYICKITQADINGSALQKAAVKVLNNPQLSGWANFTRSDSDSTKTISQVLAAYNKMRKQP